MKKLFCFFLLSLALPSCYSIKTTIGHYNLPLKVEKTPTKVGKSCGVVNLFFSDVDLTVETARKNGNITEIIAVETENNNGNICTVVRGN